MEDMSLKEARSVMQGLRNALLCFTYDHDDEHVEVMVTALAKLNDEELATVALVGADYFAHAEAVK